MIEGMIVKGLSTGSQDFYIAKIYQLVSGSSDIPLDSLTAGDIKHSVVDFASNCRWNEAADNECSDCCYDNWIRL